MTGRRIEVMIKGTVGSGVSSLTSDLVRQLEKAGARVIVDPSCTFDGLEPIGQPGQVIGNLRGADVTVKNGRLLRDAVNSVEQDNGEDKVRFQSGEYFDIRTDRMINTRVVMEILQISRSTLANWQAEGKFPKAHFKIGDQFRWVERLVLEWKAKNLEPSQHEKDEAEMHSKGVVTDEILDQ
ncbi:MAG: hypothetical protein P4L77_11595 [Sulfuriferula sp.]|nr:hypothetical protein [Sulfuriferula sp.]